jgi:hypothetical protein
MNINMGHSLRMILGDPSSIFRALVMNSNNQVFLKEAMALLKDFMRYSVCELTE